MSKARVAVTASLGKPEGECAASMAELESLLGNLGITVTGQIWQNRPHPDPGSYMGVGKLDEAAMFAPSVGAGILVIDGELTPGQRRVMSERTKMTVWDRPYVIMKIFEARAITSEARMQVQLAQYKYEIPFLKGLGQQMSRTGAGIGTRGPGETEFERHRRKIERRIKFIESRLAHVKKRRGERIERRKKEGLRNVALVGYTNSGKTTLLRRLCGDKSIDGADRLFATLDTATRSVNIADGENVLFTDTVGFIRRIPPQLLAAFRATLEETKHADMLVVVLDGSDEQAMSHYDVITETLEMIGASEICRVIFINKSDRYDKDVDDVDAALRSRGERTIPGSAVTGAGMSQLKDIVRKVLMGHMGE